MGGREKYPVYYAIYICIIGITLLQREMVKSQRVSHIMKSHIDKKIRIETLFLSLLYYLCKLADIYSLQYSEEEKKRFFLETFHMSDDKLLQCWKLYLI